MLKAKQQTYAFWWRVNEYKFPLNLHKTLHIIIIINIWRYIKTRRQRRGREEERGEGKNTWW